MKPQKATRIEIKKHNQQMVLRAIHNGAADNRAALAQITSLTKPSISEIVGELIEEGYIGETGFGDSPEGGGKRPILLQFVPSARNVIGVSLSEHGIYGLLTNLNGKIVAEHRLGFRLGQEIDLVAGLVGVINGLIAQLDRPLLAIGVGIPGEIDWGSEIATFPASYGWENLALGKLLEKQFDVPIYLANNTELTAIARFAFDTEQAERNLVAVLVNSTVEIGLVMGDNAYYSGRNIGDLRLATSGKSLEEALGWNAIQQRFEQLRSQYRTTLLEGRTLSYLQIAYAVSKGDALAQVLQNAITDDLCEVFTWVIALVHPDHISLSGEIADLGDDSLAQIVEKLHQRLPDKLVADVTFSLSIDSNLSALGAIAYALQLELGLIQW